MFMMPAGAKAWALAQRWIFCRLSGTWFFPYKTYPGLTSGTIVCRRSAAGVEWVLIMPAGLKAWATLPAELPHSSQNLA